MRPKRFFFILCGMLGAMVVLGGAGYYYASQELNEGTKQLSQRLADLELNNQKLADLEDLQRQYERLEEIKPIIFNALPTEKKQAMIALQLRSVAANSGMQLYSLTFPASAAPGPTSQTVPAGDVLAIPVTFQLRGSYGQLQQFLMQQEKLDRYTSITSLAINGSGNVLTFDITLNAFVKP